MMDGSEDGTADDEELVIPTLAELVVRARLAGQQLSSTGAMTLHPRVADRPVDVAAACSAMPQRWQAAQAFVLGFFACEATGARILLESWAFAYEPRPAPLPAPDPAALPMFIQAVLSFLHFSNLSAWARKTSGALHSRVHVLVADSPACLARALQLDGAAGRHSFRSLELPHGTVSLEVAFRQVSLPDALMACAADAAVNEPAAASQPCALELSERLRKYRTVPLVQRKRKVPTPVVIAPRAKASISMGSPDPRRRSSLSRRSQTHPAPTASTVTATAPIPIPGSPQREPQGQQQQAVSSLSSSLSLSLQQKSSLLAMSPPLLLASRQLSLSDQLSPAHNLSLLGSFEESLLTGRMSSLGASTVEGFMAKIGACGSGLCPKHVKLPLVTVFNHAQERGCPSPYVGVVNLEESLAETKGRYQVPRKGMVQVMIFNPQQTGVKLFAVSYNFSDMPPRTRTFLRQRQYVELEGSTPGGKRTSLRYAIHLRFLSSKAGHIFLHKQIRVVFSHRVPDETEKLKTSTDGPASPTYSPLPAKTQSKRAPFIRSRASLSPEPLLQDMRSDLLLAPHNGGGGGGGGIVSA